MKKTRRILWTVCDAALFCASYFFATTLAHKEYAFLVFLPLVLVKIAVLVASSVYRLLFEYANRGDYMRVLFAVSAGTFAAVTFAVLFDPVVSLNAPIILFSLLFDIIFIFLVRILRLFIFMRKDFERMLEEGQDLFSYRRNRRKGAKGGVRRVMLVGAARAIASLIDEMEKEPALRLSPTLAIIDEKEISGVGLHGVQTFSEIKKIHAFARKYQIDEIFIASPGATKARIALILRECVRTSCRISMLPRTQARAIYADDKSTPHLSELTKPTAADFFGRERPHIDHKAVGEEVRGKVVLVTGAAGVYGSELCKHILRYKPRRLVALDLDDDALTLLSSEVDAMNLRTEECEFREVVASVCDEPTMERVFSAFRPHLVFHAAEFGQIPLAQANPKEAFLTNVIGLKICADLAAEYAAQKFILISTSRARSSASVAAVSKRIAEIYVTSKKTSMTYAVLRFPNLIETRGGVIEVFQRQIARGGPVTVADKDLARDFVSAEETAVLALSAAAFAKGGEIFEVGPGLRMEIYALAEALVRLSNAEKEIPIIYTQLRRGERLYEDIAVSPGALRPISDRLWQFTEPLKKEPPDISELWEQDYSMLGDAETLDLLSRIFPSAGRETSRKAPTLRGVKIAEG